MLAQYVHTSSSGLFRIVRHGHRWRSLRGVIEIGRHAAAHDALETLLAMFPEARLPRTIERWRYLPQLALVHARTRNQDSRPWALSA